MHAQFGHFGYAQHFDLQAVAFEGLDAVGIGLRVKDVGGFRHQVAGEQDAIADRRQRRIGGLCGCDIVTDNGDRLQ